MSRFRSYVNQHTQDSSWTYTQSGVDYKVTSAFVEWNAFEEMIDSVDRTVRNHPCYHTTLAAEGVAREPWTWAGHSYTEHGGPAWNGWQPDPGSYMERFHDGIFTPSLLGDFADAAFAAFADQVPQEVDIVNFGLDFRQIGDLIPKLEESMSKTVASGYLNYSFGWKPFLSDLQKLGRLSQTVADRLAWLRDTWGKSVRLGYFQEVDYPISERFQKVSGTFYPTCLSAKATLLASGTLYHELERLNGIEGTMRGMIAALGLNSPSRVVWERIPYSFVVDWFARTKSITDSFRYQPFTGLWRVSNVCTSMKIHLNIEWRYYEAGVREHSAGFTTGDFYNRLVGLPVSSQILSGDLSPTQQLLAAALLIGAAR